MISCGIKQRGLRNVKIIYRALLKMNIVYKNIAFPILCMLAVGCVSTSGQDVVGVQNLYTQCETKVRVAVKPTYLDLQGYATATTVTVCTEVEKAHELKLTTEEK